MSSYHLLSDSPRPLTPLLALDRGCRALGVWFWAVTVLLGLWLSLTTALHLTQADFFFQVHDVSEGVLMVCLGCGGAFLEFRGSYRRVPRDVGLMSSCGGQLYQALTYFLFGAFVMGIHRYQRAPWVDLVAKVNGLTAWVLSLCHLLLSTCCTGGRGRAGGQEQ